MYPAPFSYHRPDTLQEAIGLLTRLGNEAQLLAGGHSLLPVLKLRFASPAHIIDIGRLPGLDHVEQRGSTLHIGALARHGDIAVAADAQKIAMLVDCAGNIADKQVRSMGTIGGSVAMADPNADWPNCLTALSADIVCSGPNGSRTIPIADLFVDTYTTTLANDEIITEIRIEIPGGTTGSAYMAFKRSAATYPTASVGVLLRMAGETIESASLVLGAVGSVPVVSREAEATLAGQRPGDELFRKAAEVIVAEASPSTDARGSAEFKRKMLKSLFVEAANRAVARSRGETVKGGHRYA